MKPVAICDTLLSRHQKNNAVTTQSWTQWLDDNEIPWERIDCYSTDIVSRLPNYSALLWHYENYSNADLMEAQNILDVAESMGLKVYPDHHTAWHFDDKIAEMYALQAVGAPIPESWVFYELSKCLEWLEKDAPYPIVAKLRRGSGSNNVKLLHNASEAKHYAKKMFSKGFSPAQSLAYKAYSKVQSTRDFKTFINRAKKIPDFLWSRRFGKGLPIERGYCYFQKYIENSGYDIKLAVVGEKCSFLTRHVRKADFRASGSGDIFYDRSLVPEEAVRSAFEAVKGLKAQCIGFDYVVESKTLKPYIIEMCHGFDVDAIYRANGYWTPDLVWHDKPLNVKAEILENMFKQ